MSPTTRALWRDRLAVSRLRDVVNDVVRSTGRSNATRNIVQIQERARLPCNVVVGAGRIAADANAPEERPGRTPCSRRSCVKRQTAAEYVHAANLSAFHRIQRSTVVGRISCIRYSGTDGITLLQPEKRTARLHRRIQVGRRERE